MRVDKWILYVSYFLYSDALILEILLTMSGLLTGFAHS